MEQCCSVCILDINQQNTDWFSIDNNTSITMATKGLLHINIKVDSQISIPEEFVTTQTHVKHQEKCA